MTKKMRTKQFRILSYIHKAELFVSRLMFEAFIVPDIPTCGVVHTYKNKHFTVYNVKVLTHRINPIFLISSSDLEIRV